MCLLEYFNTAWLIPIVLALIYSDKQSIFGVLSADTLSNYQKEFNDSWYALNGQGIFIQMFIYFGVNNILITYALGVFPKWYARKKNKREDYSEKDLLNNIPNTKQET